MNPEKGFHIEQKKIEFLGKLAASYWVKRDFSCANTSLASMSYVDSLKISWKCFLATTLGIFIGLLKICCIKPSIGGGHALKS